MISYAFTLRYTWAITALAFIMCFLHKITLLESEINRLTQWSRLLLFPCTPSPNYRATSPAHHSHLASAVSWVPCFLLILSLAGSTMEWYKAAMKSHLRHLYFCLRVHSILHEIYKYTFITFALQWPSEHFKTTEELLQSSHQMHLLTQNEFKEALLILHARNTV